MTRRAPLTTRELDGRILAVPALSKQDDLESCAMFLHRAMNRDFLDESRPAR